MRSSSLSKGSDVECPATETSRGESVGAVDDNEKAAQLFAAVNNMRHGLLMFDSAGRLVLYNRRFLEMYGLSPDTVKLGCTLSDLLRLRKAAGTFKGDPDLYVAKLADAHGTFKGDPDRQITRLLEEGRVETKLTELPDGRTISITNQSIFGGGWVSTHEDITDHRRAEEERDRNREFLDLIIENVPVPVFVKDASERRYILINRAAERFWGVRREEMIGRNAYDMFPKQDADLIHERDDELVRSGELNYDEREMHTPHNGIRFASSKRLTVCDPDGKPKYLVGVLEDATERRRLERERDRTQAFLNTVIENVPVTIFVKDARTLTYVLVNRAAEQLWGISRDKVIGKDVSAVFPKPAADLITARDKEQLEDKHPLFDATHQVETPGNGTRMVTSKRIVLLGDDGEPQFLLGVIEDVTESARADERIKYMAHHDLLTGLFNRVLFMEKIDEAVARLQRRGETFAIFMLDLDRFKDVNDSLGHAAGDALLREAARRLKYALRGTDVLARLGGDEFAIIQAGDADSWGDARALADRIINIFAEPFDIDGNSIAVGVSIGIAMAPIHGDEPSHLMKKADLALYRAKSEGRNGYSLFDAQLAADADARHQLERDLREAICGDELEVHYQPIIDASTRKPCGAEALARWRHRQGGFVPASQFIPHAEETGLIIPIGELVLRKACADAAGWPRHIKVAINLSPLQFTKSNLLDVIKCSLDESGLPPERLELEITETLLIERHLDVLPVIQQLKGLGISIVLDDFGTGYSSLSYLTMFPFDKMKIDKSFTQNIACRPECAAIISSARALAYSLGITIVAEGVETEQQFELLRAAGVDLVQGYLFGHPCPESKLNFASIGDATRIGDAA
jgi:diguanylate cyclase (GGDEF)-like protein/PAS domain S-box-containing protein